MVTPRLRGLLEEHPPGYLFPGRFTGHLHPATVQKHVKAAAGTAPHALRHRFATRAYAGTRDLFAVHLASNSQSVGNGDEVLCEACWISRHVVVLS